MKKITLCIFLLITSFSFSQTYSTGPVVVTAGYTIQFDVDSNSNIVTLTLIGPANQWLGVGPGISAGLGMGNLGDDAIVYNSSGLQDRNMPSGTGTPNLDASQDWNVCPTCDTVDGSTRTVIATRARDTGDSNDFVFPTTSGALPILWAKGSSLSFGYHGGTRGGVVANLTLGSEDFEISNFKIVPNPVTSEFSIELPARVETAQMQIFDVLGKQLILNEISKLNSTVDVTGLQSGVYMVRVSNGNSSQTKRIIKQ